MWPSLQQPRQQNSCATLCVDFSDCNREHQDRCLATRSPDPSRPVVSFPLRASPSCLPQASSLILPNPLGNEYHLRRKTPNGTIDAAYDNSTTSLGHKPPPSKQLILPVSSTQASYVSQGSASEKLPRASASSWESPIHQESFQPDRIRYQADDIPNYLPTTTYDRMSQADFGGSTLLEVESPTLLHCDRNIRTPNSFHPMVSPTTRFEDLRRLAVESTHPMWYVSPSSTTRNTPHSFSSHATSTHRPSEDLKQSVQFRTKMYSPNLETQGLFDAMVSRGTEHIIQPRFRERALLQAYRCYLDLLGYIQASGKSGLGKDAESNKVFVYPKPPRLRSFLTFPGTERAKEEQSSKPTPTDYMQGSSGHRQRPLKSSQSNKGQSFISRHPSGPCHPQPGIFGRSRHTGHRILNISNKPAQGSVIVDSSPSTGARLSLELLNSLCEQSNWSWIPGILLGGCLHFGLGNHEDALHWFSKVIALDSSHVEAITDLAATLYTLGRKGEAEQHWLRAIKLRPDCLDAAEHLVGLLFRGRSREAIEAISHVQRALKIHDPRMMSGALPRTTIYAKSTANLSASYLAHTASSSQPCVSSGCFDAEAQAYGSSGYGLAGSENARILALVHAKGTMLYGLKLVDEASKAFEEAVLISVGQRFSSIKHLVRCIQAALASTEPALNTKGPLSRQSCDPLLLSPQHARGTASLLFGGRGELPGLHLVSSGAPTRAATQITSNSLLSLAKIYQDAFSSGENYPGLLRRSASVADTLALYYLSLSLQESPSTANNVGILLAGIKCAEGKTDGSHLGWFPSATPGLPSLPPGRGPALAFLYYQYGLLLDPKHVHLHTNLGSLLKDLGHLDQAIRIYEQAVSCDGTFDIALTNLANAVKDKGRIGDAIEYYKRAVSVNPNFAEAICGLSTTLNSVCDWKGRGGVVFNHGQYDRWHVNENGLLIDGQSKRSGNGLTNRVVSVVQQQLQEGSQWGRNILQDDLIDTLSSQVSDICGTPKESVKKWLQAWRGKPWEGARVVRLAERVTRFVLRKEYHFRHHVVGYDCSSQARSRILLPPSLAIPSAPTVLPFHTFTCPLTARDIRKVSQRHGTRISCSTIKSPWISPSVYPPPPPPRPRLNVGYVSSDFNNHPLAHLMQSVFGFHNRERVLAICYATSSSDSSPYRQQIESEAPIFRDVTRWSPERLLKQIISDEIHILVNLNGYTRGARNEIFAARVAPIQMSFMGFAGTLGAEWSDYLLADMTTVPLTTLRPCRDNMSIESVFQDENEGDDGEWMYSENIIFCQDTFFCCDHAQSSESKDLVMTWEEEQRRRWELRKEIFPLIADDAIILGNFNQLYKIDPTSFRTWLRILAGVPKAILWLLRFPELGETNLRETAILWAGREVASRLIFTDVVPKNQHISRARVCDLFLDTPECNAHTTAADVLWSSTPLLTLPRYPFKMCSRMAASILRGALPKSDEGQRIYVELVATSESSYEQSAISLASNLTYIAASTGHREGRGRLAEMRKTLWDSRWTCTLFDTRRWVRNIETAYEEAWRRWVAGKGGDIFL